MRSNGIQGTLVMVAAGLAIAVGGFLAGRAIGDGDNSDPTNASAPSSFSTRQSSLAVPTLGEEKPLPTLETTQPPAESEAEESQESGTAGSSETEFESETPSESAKSEQGVEVTVAPNG